MGSANWCIPAYFHDFIRYNNVKYARWGTIYRNKTQQSKTNLDRIWGSKFDVKLSSHQFNQLDPDQNPEEWREYILVHYEEIQSESQRFHRSVPSKWATTFEFRPHLDNVSIIIEHMISTAPTDKIRHVTDIRVPYVMHAVFAKWFPLKSVAGKTFPAHAQPTIIRIW